MCFVLSRASLLVSLLSTQKQQQRQTKVTHLLTRSLRELKKRPIALRLSIPTRRVPIKTQSTLCYVSYIYPSHELFSATINSFVGGCALLCFALAFVPLLELADNKQEDERLINEASPDELETIKWSVASVCSCLPCFNWTSWVLVAFDSESPFAYYFLACLYLIPSLKSGFQFDGFSVCMLILGILHMQVERVVQTEPNFFGTVPRSGDINQDRKEVLGNSPLSVMKIFKEYFQRQTPLRFSEKACDGDERRKSSIAEMVDRELDNTEKELSDAKELANLEKQFWDDQFDRKNK